MGYHPCDIGILTCGSESSRGTLLGGQFDWGGRLLKSNGGVQRFAQLERKSSKRVQTQKEPNCETDRSSSNAPGVSDPVVCEWKCHRSTDKSYPGDNRLISPKSPHRRGGLAPRCRLIASWGCIRSQGFGCSPIKAVRELVRQFGPYLLRAYCRGRRIFDGAVPVREDRDGRTSGAPVVPPGA